MDFQMDFKPDPLQTLYLWALLFQHGGQAPENEIRPRLGPARRDPGKISGAQRRQELERAGLIQITRGARGRLTLDLTERGWAWADASLEAPVAATSTAAGPILQAALGRLKSYLNLQQASVAQLFLPQEPSGADASPGGSSAPAARNPDPDSDAVLAAYAKLAAGQAQARVPAGRNQDPAPDTVLAAYAKLAAGQAQARVRIADLMADLLQALPATDPGAVHQALLTLHRRGEILLLPGENPRELNAQDHRFAIKIAGTPNHFLRMDRK